jgi:Kef-type K+ transport system membrane component KefB/nucleotide-binding universal stress UspA family protein
MQEVIPPISGHAIVVLLLQLAALLLLARLLAEGMQRIGQPAVLGELLAGFLLGPTVLGHLAPVLFATAFPQEVSQFHLLEVVSSLGMVLLLLLTGLETDIRAMTHLGRAALMASVFGMVIPFAGGLVLGWFLPDVFLTDPANRPVFAAFLATAMAISAMPVIAKILIDLNLMRRNVGMVILSAGVVDDTTGWLILSVIAGIVTAGSFRLLDLGLTLLWLATFLAVMRWVAYPAMAAAIRFVNERVDLAGGDLTLILGFTFMAAGVTEAIGVHAVFGAFVAGLVVRQIRRVQTSSLHTLEVFVLSALSPIFFAYVGLKVDLWTLSGWELPALVIAVATAGKLVGCYVGGRAGGMSHWESMALGFGMNARGGMGLILALIGLSLGLLTLEMYSTIVLVAVVTSFMAPLLLRWVVPRLPLNEDERRRLEDTDTKRLIPAGTIRVLVPTAGGKNAEGALRLAAPIVRSHNGQLVAFYIERAAGDGTRKWPFSRRRSLAGSGLEEHFARVAAMMSQGNGAFSSRRATDPDVAHAVVDEAGRDYDMLMIGAASDTSLHDPRTRQIVESAPVPVVIVRRGEPGTPMTGARLLLPFDGSVFARYAAEFAFAYAGASAGEVTVLHIVNEARLAMGSLPMPERRAGHALPRGETAALAAQLEEELGPIAARHEAHFTPRIISGASPAEVVIAEANSGFHDLLVLGAENKLLGARLFYGQGTAEILERSRCTTAIVIPRTD